MKKVFLTSDTRCSEKIDGVRYSRPIDNKNHIIEQIKKYLNKQEKFIMIASSPDDYEKNDSYFKLTFESFNKSGFDFKNGKIIDNRFKGNIKEEILNSDIVFLCGGHTPTEMKYFEEINLREILKEYEGIIIGQSAGSLNLADMVVCAPEYEEEIGTNYVWKGLGQTNVNIEPHFNLEDNDILRKELLKLSLEYPIYAICDGTHIFDNGEVATIYGDAYYISGGNVEKICSDGGVLKIDEFEKNKKI